ncbi:MAG TPA: arginine--tRNA ligase [Candidatus Vogelbacteria bacterium]|nr:arginine--tRNA ligase [Candidatus Vogelbacteria bacterium]
MLEKKIKLETTEILKKMGVRGPKFIVEHPTDMSLGDYSLNGALIYGKKLNKNPLDLAVEIISELKKRNIPEISKMDIAGFGFINIFLKDDFFANSLEKIIKSSRNFGKIKSNQGKKIAIEYTDPNPFKEFHIGHMMTNFIGESLARIFEFSGAEVKRFCYSGDVGLHVAKAIYGLKQNLHLLLWQKLFGQQTSRARFLGDCYAYGDKKYREDEKARQQIVEINKEIYGQKKFLTKFIYNLGRQWSLDEFAEIYDILDTKFDFSFFESQTAIRGVELVKEYLAKDIFVFSDQAIIFPGEKYNLHTRVFINSHNLPTYEAKDLALAEIKYESYPYDLSFIVTGNEVNDYFAVVLKALEEIYPNLAQRTKHIGHGMLKLPSGKMSSRTGSVIAFKSLLKDIEKIIEEKMSERLLSKKEKQQAIQDIALGALRFAVLKQSPGKDIIFDFNKSLSFEGDSGPYLQYSARRAESCLDEAKKIGLECSFSRPDNWPLENLERLLYRFPEEVARAGENSSPQIIISYLLNLAGNFNNFYSREKIVDKDDPTASYKLALTMAFFQVMENGLYLLGIRIPSKM